jgi:hypothetical protein
LATQLKKTVKPSGGDYTSLEACMNANEQNLVTADKYFDVEIDGTWSSADTSAVTIHNYTTDATRYINIYTTSAARHLGVWSSSYYVLSTTPASEQQAIALPDAYITITGIQCTIAPSGGYGRGIIWGGLNALVQKCIIRRSGGASAGNHLLATGKAWNNIIYNAGGCGIYPTGNSWVIYNNTVYGCGLYGIGNRSGTWTGSALLKNNLSYNNDTDYSFYQFYITRSNNLSKDTTGDAGYTSETITFTNTGAGTEDLHLVVGDTDAIDRGADLSGTFTDDIDGVTRSGTWDIGADEYVAAAGGWTSGGKVKNIV